MNGFGTELDYCPPPGIARGAGFVFAGLSAAMQIILIIFGAAERKFPTFFNLWSPQ